MVGKAIGEILPYAAGAAISVVPIIAIILMLVTPKAKTNGASFAVGFVLGLALICVVAVALAGGNGLGDAADGVVIGEGEQLDAGLGGALDDLGGREGAVGVGGVRLQVEAGRHPAERMRSDQRLACAWPTGSSARRMRRVTRWPMAVRRRRTAAW